MARSLPLLALLLSSLSVGTAHHIPSRLSRPLYAPATLKRATSQDPSCPAGFLCVQEPCPGSAICPPGEMCLNFEGTLACVPLGSSFCALNPDSFEGVGCWNGMCCHGQCYASNAVCCDNASTWCTLGKACNVCSPGQQCANGGGCSGESTPDPEDPPAATSSSSIQAPVVSPTLTPKPTSSSTPVAQPTTLSSSAAEPKPTTSSSRSSSPSTSSTPKPTSSSSSRPEIKPTTSGAPMVTPSASTSSSSSTVPPSPTTVVSVSPFQSPICVQDFTDNRVLVNGSTSDLSATGMTVEKCIELAQGWQYAGVQYGGECFWGDYPNNPQSANPSDCSQPCSGDAREICGNGNRMIMYRDPTWVIPTRPDLGAQVQEYLELLAELQQKIQQWNDLIQQATAQQGSNTKFRRQANADLLAQIASARAGILSLQARWRQLTATLNRHFKTGDNYQILEEIEMDDLARLYPPVDEQLAAIAADAAVVANSGLNIVGTIAGRALTIVGRRRVIQGGVVIVTATGVFKIGFSLLDSLLGSSDTDSPPQPSISIPQTVPPSSTPTPTKTSSSTSSTTTTCTYTEGPTPIIVLTKKGTTRAQFDELVNSLPLDKESTTLTAAYLPHWCYIGEMDRCTAEKLWENPIVEAMTLNRKVVMFDADNVDPRSIDVNAPVEKRKIVRRTEYPAKRGMKQEGNGTELVRGRALGENKRYVVQFDSGTHLRFISGQSRQKANVGQFYDFEDYLYDDRSRDVAPVFPPRIYIVDTNFLSTHEDFSNRVRGKIAVVGGFDNVESSHGTCMSSIAAGSWTGVDKGADLVLVQAKFNQRDDAVAIDYVIQAFAEIINDVVSLGLQGNAVVSMSFGVPARYLWFDDDEKHNYDVMGIYINALADIGVAAAASAGNYAGVTGLEDFATLEAHSPRRNGGANHPLVVVGNADPTGNRYRTSNWVDTHGRGILTVYGPGTDVLCAVKTDTNAYGVEPPGTSQATAATAGLMAYFLSDPALHAQFVAGGVGNMPMRLKQHLVSVATAQKGVGGWGDENTDYVPRLANGENVECGGEGVVKGGPPVPEYVKPPETARGKRLSTVVVSEGMGVVLPETMRPGCYNRQ